MKAMNWIVALALTAPLAVTPAFADDNGGGSGSAVINQDQNQMKDLKMADLPSAVRTTVRREAKDQTVQSIQKDTMNGKTVYKVDIGSGDNAQRLQISLAGNVLTRHALNNSLNGHDSAPLSD
ncbi:MAG TPA: hypothetical protein VGF94_27100 [Kofleriaceae bacterium]|jgi:hypothetical protein